MIRRLKEHYVVGYDAVPYISDVYTAYGKAFPADRVALVEFKEAVEKVYPTLKGFPPRSLKPKRKDITKLAPPSSVRPALRQLDGTNDADNSGQLDGPDAKVRSARGQTTYSIYEDPQARSGPNDASSGTGEAATLKKSRVDSIPPVLLSRSKKENHQQQHKA